jgi:hypothetical protein
MQITKPMIEHKNVVSQIYLPCLLLAKAMIPKISAITAIIKQVMPKPINNAALKNMHKYTIYCKIFIFK